MYGSVKVWQEIISLPTWTTGAEDPNPMFLEKRVYQGSSGSVYPYGVIDTLTGEREMRDYQAGAGRNRATEKRAEGAHSCRFRRVLVVVATKAPTCLAN